MEITNINYGEDQILITFEGCKWKHGGIIIQPDCKELKTNISIYSLDGECCEVFITVCFEDELIEKLRTMYESDDYSFLLADQKLSPRVERLFNDGLPPMRRLPGNHASKRRRAD